MSTEQPTTPATALATREKSTLVKTSTGLRSQSSTVLANVGSKEEEKQPSKLYDGPIEFSKPGYPPFVLSHLVAYTSGNETVVILTNKPQLITHGEAPEQIVPLLSANPNQFLYLSRVCSGPEGVNSGLCRDLITEYAFEWEWARSSWHTTQHTYCYRVPPMVEKAIGQLLTIQAPLVSARVVEMD